MNAQWTDAKTWHHLPAKDWEVRAMLAGAKTEIVRPAKWPLWADPEEHGPLLAQSPTGIAYYRDGKPTRHMTCPYGLPGDGIYIREAWAPGDLIFDNHVCSPPRWVWYRADDSLRCFDGTNAADPDMRRPSQWQPSSRMPRELSRLRRIVKSVRVERVQNITEAGALAEGMGGVTFEDLLGMGAWIDIARAWGYCQDSWPMPGTMEEQWVSELAMWERFELIWRLAYPDSWERNDWIWVVSWA